SGSALAEGYNHVVAKRRYAEQGACSPGDSVVACDVFLAHGGEHEALRPRSSHRRNGDFSTACRQTPRAYAFSPPESSSMSLAAARTAVLPPFRKIPPGPPFAKGGKAHHQ